MVGWSSRNRRDAERHERYLKWYWSLTDEKRAEVDRRHEEEWRKSKARIMAFTAAAALGLAAMAWGAGRLPAEAPQPRPAAEWRPTAPR